MAYLKGQVANAQQMGAPDAAAQWSNYLQSVEQLQAQLPSGGARVAQALKSCVDQLGLSGQQFSGAL